MVKLICQVAMVRERNCLNVKHTVAGGAEVDKLQAFFQSIRTAISPETLVMGNRVFEYAGKDLTPDSDFQTRQRGTQNYKVNGIP